MGEVDVDIQTGELDAEVEDRPWYYDYFSGKTPIFTTFFIEDFESRVEFENIMELYYNDIVASLEVIIERARKATKLEDLLSLEKYYMTCAIMNGRLHDYLDWCRKKGDELKSFAHDVSNFSSTPISLAFLDDDLSFEQKKAKIISTAEYVWDLFKGIDWKTGKTTVTFSKIGVFRDIVESRKIKINSLVSTKITNGIIFLEDDLIIQCNTSLLVRLFINIEQNIKRQRDNENYIDSLEIEIFKKGDFIYLIFKDNGKGFPIDSDAEKAEAADGVEYTPYIPKEGQSGHGGQGIGLKGMVDLVKKFGGEMTMGTYYDESGKPAGAITQLKFKIVRKGSAKGYSSNK